MPTLRQALVRLTAEETASLISNGDTVGFSGFTCAGTPKVVPSAIAARAETEHAAGREFQIGVLTGASTSDMLDGALSRAGAIAFRTPYQSDATLRKHINAGKTRFFDMHLSSLPQAVRYGFLGPVHWAIIEACDVTPDGKITPTAGVGTAPTYCREAPRIIVELNRHHPAALRGMHDIYEPADPPYRREIPVYTPADRIGDETIRVDPDKIVGVVETNHEEDLRPFAEPDATTARIGELVAEFLASERRAGRIPREFLPLQSGVGVTANAVLRSLGDHPDIPPFSMYTEVVQDGAIDLMRTGKLQFASSCSLTVTAPKLREIYADLEWFKKHIVLRPQEISNNPEVVRRLGVISINTAIEVDLLGNANSTHVMGRQLMNGIGGSGDFTRNAYVSIFTCPSTTKEGAISTIVPLVTHMDHNEHSVKVIVTEQGIADLRGKDPLERARLIIENCAHPDFRDELFSYLGSVKNGHSPFTLGAAFAMHQQYILSGNMRGVDWTSLFERFVSGAVAPR